MGKSDGGREEEKGTDSAFTVQKYWWGTSRHNLLKVVQAIMPLRSLWWARSYWQTDTRSIIKRRSAFSTTQTPSSMTASILWVSPTAGCPRWPKSPLVSPVPPAWVWPVAPYGHFPICVVSPKDKQEQWGLTLTGGSSSEPITKADVVGGLCQEGLMGQFAGRSWCRFHSRGASVCAKRHLRKWLPWTPLIIIGCKLFHQRASWRRLSGKDNSLMSVIDVSMTTTAQWAPV